MQGSLSSRPCSELQLPPTPHFWGEGGGGNSPLYCPLSSSSLVVWDPQLCQDGHHSCCRPTGYRAEDPEAACGHPLARSWTRVCPKGTLLKWIQTHKSHLYLAQRVRDEGAGGLAGLPLRKQGPPCEPGLPCDQGNRTEGVPTPVGWSPRTNEAEEHPAPPLFFWHHEDPTP